MARKYYRIRLVVEECKPMGDDGTIKAVEYTHYRIVSSFTNVHKAMGRFNAIQRLIEKEYSPK